MDPLLDSDSLNITKLCTRAHAAALQIVSACDAALVPAGTDREYAKPQQELRGCDEPLLVLLRRLAVGIADVYEEHDETTALSVAKLRRRVDDLLGMAYARFYAYVFSELPVCWRALYTEASILKFGLVLWASRFEAHTAGLERKAGDQPGHGQDDKRGEDEDDISALVRPLDLAIILAGAAGQERGRRWIDVTLEILAQFAREESQDNGRGSLKRVAPLGQRSNKRLKLEQHHPEDWNSHPSFSTHEPFTPPLSQPIGRLPAQSMDTFQEYLDKPHKPGRGPEPVVITGLTDHWPSRTTHPWNKPAYLLAQTLGGRRLVPIELGRSYVDDGWGQKIVSMRTLLDTYIQPHGTTPQPSTPDTEPKPPTAYLAQHPLLSQLPILAADITTPDLCYTCPPPHPFDPSQDQPELIDGPRVNAWLGPAGTITPLHTDPYHNLLTQVVGRKYVRLYAPHEGVRMAPRGQEGGVDMGNTSEIDVGVVEGWDGKEEEEGMSEEERRMFKEVPFVNCILEPGDTLYIPIGWWHYVRGLSVSFSVSFWWN